MVHDKTNRDGRTQFIMNGTLVEANLGLVYQPDTGKYIHKPNTDRVYSFTKFINNHIELRIRAYGEDSTWFVESPAKWNVHYRNGILTFENRSYNNTWLNSESADYNYTADFENHDADAFKSADPIDSTQFRISYNLKHHDYNGLNWALDKYINDFWITWYLSSRAEDQTSNDTFRVHINGKYLSKESVVLNTDPWRGYINYEKRVKYEYLDSNNVWTPHPKLDDKFINSVDTWKHLNMHGGGRNAIFGHVMFDNTSKDNSFYFNSENRDTYSARIHEYYGIDNIHLRTITNDGNIGPYGPLLKDQLSTYNQPLKEFYQYNEKFDQYAFGLTRHDLALTWVGKDTSNMSESFLFFKPLNYTWDDWDTVARSNWIWNSASGTEKRIDFLNDKPENGVKPYFYPPTKPAIYDEDATLWVKHEFERLGHANNNDKTSRPLFEFGTSGTKIPLNSWEAMQQESFSTAFDFNSKPELLQLEGDLNDMITDSNCQSTFNNAENFWSKRFSNTTLDSIVFPDTGIYTKDDGTLYSTQVHNQLKNKNSIGCYGFMNIQEVKDFFTNIKTNVDSLESGYTIGVTGVFTHTDSASAANWNYTDANIINALNDDSFHESIKTKAINPTLAYTLGQNMALYKHFPSELVDPSASDSAYKNTEGSLGKYYKHAVNNGKDNVFSVRFRMLTASTRIVQVDSTYTPADSFLKNKDNFYGNLENNLEHIMNPDIDLRSNSFRGSTPQKEMYNSTNVPNGTQPQIYMEGELYDRYSFDGTYAFYADSNIDAPFKRAKRWVSTPAGGVSEISRENDPAISSFMISGGLDHLFLNQNRYYDEGTYDNSENWVGNRNNDKSEKPYEFSSWSLVFDGETSQISFYVANVNENNYPDMQLEDTSITDNFKPSNTQDVEPVFSVNLNDVNLAWKNPRSAYGDQFGPFCYKLDNGLFYNSALDFVLNVEFATITLFCNGVRIAEGSSPNTWAKNYTGAEHDTINYGYNAVIPLFNQIKIINTTPSDQKTKVQHFPLDDVHESDTTTLVNGTLNPDSNIMYDRPLIIDLFEFTRTRAWKQHYLEVVSNPFVSTYNTVKVPETNDAGVPLENRYVYQPPPWFPSHIKKDTYAAGDLENLYSDSIPHEPDPWGQLQNRDPSKYTTPQVYS
tara:strand:- start:4662 stop:8090 length:3429 start_codon:yes stop_codon:yes gene_type:complete